MFKAIVSKSQMVGESRRSASKWYAYFLAIGSLAGTIIGLGMFGIPYVAMKSGIWLTLGYILILGLITFLLHAMYLEITLRTKESHRFPGYVEIYLGKKWKHFSFLLGIVGASGSLLIYTIVGGEFINILIGPVFGNSVFWSGIAFFVFGSYMIIRPFRDIGKIEAICTVLMVAAVFWFLAKGIFGGYANYDNFSSINWDEWFLPYGVILFAMGGFSMIPSLENILDKEIKKGERIHFGKIAFWGTFIPMIVYAVFAVAVLGITGAGTSEEALTGLQGVFGNGLVKIAALIGFLALFTSFIAIGNDLKRNFTDDYRLPNLMSVVLTLFPPLAVFLFKIAGFIEVMGFLGGALGVYAYVIIILLFYRAKKNGEMTPLFSFQFPKWLACILAVMFIIAGIYTIMEML
ncbi:MAG: aromatic amino acid transport family protein [Patescibacteria group bacterium]